MFIAESAERGGRAGNGNGSHEQRDTRAGSKFGNFLFHNFKWLNSLFTDAKSFPCAINGNISGTLQICKESGASARRPARNTRANRERNFQQLEFSAAEILCKAGNKSARR
jgi:hypothetical protein